MVFNINTKLKLIVAVFAFLGVMFFMTSSARAATVTWTGTTSTAWATATNWSPNQVPTSADDVVINYTGTNQPTLTVQSGSVTVNSLTLGGGASASTLTVSYGDATHKLIVTANATIQNNGVLTHTANTTAETHRLFMDVGGNLDVQTGGQINVDGKGYAGAGPGYTSNRGASYGGQGYGGSATYGSLISPVSLGSGAINGASYGGGAVILNISGAVTVNGNITAIGTGGNGSSGGTISISSATISGPGGLKVNAHSDGGGGGRIAVKLTSGNDFGSVAMQAYEGSSYGIGAAGTIYTETQAQGANNGIVTIDNNNIAASVYTAIPATQTWTIKNLVLKNKGQMSVPAGTTLDLSSATISTTDASALSGIVVNGGTLTAGNLSYSGIFVNITSAGAFNSSGLTVGSLGTFSSSIATTINGDFTFSGASATFSSTANITGNFSATAGAVTFSNTATIGGNFTYNGSGTLTMTAPSSIGGALSLGGGASSSTLTLSNGTATNKLVVTGNATILNNGVLTHTANTSAETHRLFMDVGGNLDVQTGGQINANNKGYATGSTTVGYGPGAASASNKGGSYGGQGNGSAATYGDLLNPVNIGSSGVLLNDGGGAIILSVTGSATINGIVSANGRIGRWDNSAGAGGTVNISASTVSGSESITANGGVSSGSVGSGGGRIAVKLAAGNDFGSVVMQAFGGTGGGAGTIYTQTQAQGAGNGTLTIDNNNISATVYTAIPSTQTWTIKNLVLKNKGQISVPTGTTLDISSGTLTTTDATNISGILVNGGTFATGNLSYAKMFLNITSAAAFNSSGLTVGSLGTFSSSIATTINGDFTFSGASATFSSTANITGNFSATAGAVTFSNTATVGGNFIYSSSGALAMVAPSSIGGAFTLGGGDLTSTLTLSNGSPTNKLAITGNATILNNGYLTHTANTTAETHRLFMDVGGNLDVQSGGQINADGKGYAAQKGPGACSGVSSYGGNGEASSNCSPYGSLTDPINLGSGGSNLGGGAIVLSITGTAAMNGLISSNSNTSGTGGTINISANSIAGSGTLKTNGGKGSYGVSYAGSGGRIAIKLVSGNDFGSIVMQSYSGAAGMGYAAAGTVYTQTALQGSGNGTVTIDNNNQGAGVYTAIPSAQTWAIKNLVLKNRGQISVPTGTTLDISSATISTTDASALSGIVANGGTLNTGTGTFSYSGISLNATTSAFSSTGGFSVGTNGTFSSSVAATINGDFIMSGSSATFSNTASITGNFSATAGAVTFSNTANVTGNFSSTSSGTITLTAPSTISGHLSLGGGASTSTLTLSNGSATNKLTVTGNATILSNGYLTHTANTTAETHRLFMDVGGSLDVQTGGQINVDGKGYSVNNGPGFLSASGGYGGQGGGSGLTYGSITDPVNLGSGGSYAGSGSIVLNVTGSTTVNGTISSSVIDSGSGGTISIVTNSVIGSGLLKANGGKGSYGNYNPGGGGRIAIKLVSGNDFGSLIMQAYGGSPGAGSGGAAGTIYTQNASQGAGNGTVTIDDNNTGTTVYTAIPSTQTWTIKNLVLKNKGQISVPSGTTLDLTGATITNDGLGTSGINVNGGTLLSSSGTLTVNGIYLTTTAPQTIGGNLIIGGGSTTSTLTLSNGSPTNKFTVTGNVTIANNGYLTHTANTTAETHRLFMDVGGNLDVQSGGQINVDAKGYAAGSGPGACSGSGSYGGQSSVASCSAATYGSLTNPVNLGSGGYISNPYGGGAIVVSVIGQATINGNVTSGGFNSDSGGSVNIVAGNVIGSGVIRANGGASNGGIPAGGGGRIAVKLASGNDFGSVSMQAYGGIYAPSGIYAAAGTIYTETASQGAGNGTVIIDNNNQTASVYTAIPSTQTWTIKNLVLKNKGQISVPTGTTLDISSGTLTTTDATNISGILVNGGTFATGNLSYAKMFLNITSAAAFNSSGLTVGSLGTFSSSIATTINGDFTFSGASATFSSTANITGNFSATAGAVTFSNTATVGGNFIYSSSGALAMVAPSSIGGAFTLGGGASTSTLTLSNGSPTNKLTVTGNATILNNGYLTHTANTTAETHRLFMDVGGSLDVQTGGQINVDNKGYSSNNGPGKSGSGGAYGGSASDGGATYGSINNPVNIGSSGSNTQLGGGAIILTISGSATVNGLVTATAGTNTIPYHGSSGGTVNISASTILGFGTIKANGTGKPGGVGGGGGRIAAKLATGNDFGSVVMQAYGSSESLGAAGTIYTETQAQGAGNGTVTIDNNNTVATATTLIPTSNFTNNALSLGNVIVKNKGILSIPTGTTLTTTGDIIVGTSGSSTDTAQIIANGSAFLVAKNITVHGVAGAGASINANATGNAAGVGTGAGTTGSSGYGSGASYGGKGSNSADGGIAPNTYGSEGNPTDLGSGGGKSTGGTGGGALFITAANALNILGTISSNGGAATTNGGGGSGGTVNIKNANNLTVSGRIQANGGAGQGSGGNGGGGRITYAYTTKNVTGTIQAIAGTGGTGTASAGTVRSGSLSGTLVSSAYDSSSEANLIGGISWKEDQTLPAGTTVTFNMRTAQDKASLSSQSWTPIATSTPSSLTAGCTKNTTTVSCTDAVIPASFKDMSNDRFFQYQAVLTSPDLSSTPTIDDVQVLYVVNAPPQIQNPTVAQQNSADPVTITYAVLDPDTGTGTFTPNFVTPALQYSLDSGLTWNTINPNAITFNAAPSGGQITDTNADGKMDNKVLAGSYLTYSLNWNAQQQLGTNIDTATAKIKITVSDNEAANNAATVQTGDFTLKTLSLSNVSATQSSEPATLGRVIIAYTHAIQSNIQSQETVSLEYWNGSVWKSATAATGDIGANISSGSRQIVWNAKADMPEYFSAQAKVRLVSSYNSTAQTLTASEYLLDTKNPILDFIPLVIDHSIDANQISLKTPTDDSSYQMMLSVSSNFSGASLENFSSTYTMNLTDDPARVYLRIQDQYGNYTDATAITPDKPRHMQFFDISRPQEDVYQEFIGWDVISPMQSGSGLPVYEVYRKDDTQNDFSLLTSISNTRLNYYLDTSLDKDRTYSYKVRTRDSHNDISQFGSVIEDKPDGQGGSDTTPPTISEVSIPNAAITTTTATVTWKTDELSNSSVGYATVNDTQYFPETGVASMNLVHQVILTGLTPGTSYHIRIKSEDINGNRAENDQANPGLNSSADFNFETLKGPAISAVTVPSISNNQATVAWKTDVNSSSLVVFSPTLKENGELNNPQEVGSLSLVGGSSPYHHEVTVDSYEGQPLLKNTRYYFYVKSVDANGDIAMDNNAGNMYELLTTEDTEPPVISQVQVPVISNQSVTVSWVTDKPATSKVFYGKDQGGPYIETNISASYDRNHFVILSNLEPDTTYYFKVASKDINKNETESLEFDFITIMDPEFQHDPLAKIMDTASPAKDLTDPQSSETFKPSILTDTTAVVRFNTFDQNDVPVGAQCHIQHRSDSMAYSPIDTVLEENYNANHSMTISGLISATKHFFQIECTDNLGNFVTSQEFNFTTRDKLYTAAGADALGDHLAPIISNVGVGNVTGESVTITWDTDEKASSLVKYGILNSGENMAGDAVVNDTVETYDTAHSVIIGGLVPATKYFYKAYSTDASGNISQSSESSFTTASPSSLSSITATSAEIGQATIAWATNQPMTSMVEYGLTATYGQSKNDTALTKEHTVTLSNLEQGRVYHFRVKGKNSDNAIFASADNTFEPKSPPVVTNIVFENVTEHEATVKFSTNVPTDADVAYVDSNNAENSGNQGKPDYTTNHELQLKNLASGITFSTKIRARDQQGSETEMQGPEFSTEKDVTTPKFERIKTDMALSQNDKVQAIVTWTTNEPAIGTVTYREGQGGEEKTFEMEKSFVNNHVAVITVFKPGTVYYYKVRSKDSSGNEGVSDDFAILTPKKSQNVIQVIISNFQDIFGWASLGK